MKRIFKRVIAIVAAAAVLLAADRSPVREEKAHAAGDSMSTAETLSLNVPVSQSMNGKGELYYKYVKSQAGYFQVKFQHDNYTVTSDYFLITAMSADTQRIYQWYSEGNDTSDESPVLGVPAGTFYVVVECLVDSGASFVLEISDDKNSANYEVEPNDELTNATQLTLGTEIKGAVTRFRDKEEKKIYSDYDYFRFDVKRESKIDFKFRHNKAASGDYSWEISLLDAQEKELYKWTSKVTDDGVSQSDITIQAGTYYYLITSGTSASVRTYGLTVTDVTPAATATPAPTPTATAQPTFVEKKLERVQGLRVKAKRGRKIKVSWYSVPYADEYIVECATSRNFSRGFRDRTVYGRSCTIRGLKKNKKYFVRVCAAAEGTRVENGVTYLFDVGRYSAVKKVRVKK